MPEALRPTPGKVLSLPKTRRISWSAMVLESGHQIILALWIGSLVAIVSLGVPGLLDFVPDPNEAARASLILLGRLGVLGVGAGSYLLLTTLLMYLLSLRRTRTLIFQAGLILVMTAIAVALQVWLAPRLFGMIRLNPTLLSGGGEEALLRSFRTLFGVYLGALLVQAVIGTALLLTGVRRWYRYVRLQRGAEQPL